MMQLLHRVEMVQQVEQAVVAVANPFLVQALKPQEAASPQAAQLYTRPT
jgi:hypothetical protein